MVQDEVVFYGHPNVQSLHVKTIEVTKDKHLSLKGDCIIGVKANKACLDLDGLLKLRLRQNDAVVKMEIIVGNEKLQVSGYGDDRLTLQNKHDIVIRKSNFVCPRTMSVRCDKASSDIPKSIVNLLRNPETKGIFRITAE